MVNNTMCTLGLGMYLLVGAAHADIPNAPPCPTSLSGITFCNKISNSNEACTTTINGQDWYAFYNDGTDPHDSSVPLATYDETSDEWDTIFKNYFNCKGGEEKDADPDHCSTFDCGYDGGICCFGPDWNTGWEDTGFVELKHAGVDCSAPDSGC